MDMLLRVALVSVACVCVLDETRRLLLWVGPSIGIQDPPAAFTISLLIFGLYTYLLTAVVWPLKKG